MIAKCEKTDEGRILDYIGADYPCCLYLYLDLKQYGVGSGEIEVYSQSEGGAVTAVMLKYHTCLHVYSRDNTFDAAELGRFFAENGFSMLQSRKETAERVYAALPEALGQKAEITCGWVAQIKAVDRPAGGLAENARDEDFPQIAALVFDDEDIGKSYQYEDLVRQLRERRDTGYARNLVIRQGELVVAHGCTNAELGKIAVAAELMVRRGYRGQGYASEVWRDLCGTLLSEGKEVYSFYYSEESRRLHRHIGFFEVCEWAKVVVGF